MQRTHKDVFYPTEEGVPQGGIISPTLMLITLSGLEREAKQASPKRSDKVNVIVYADDFIITGSSKEILENKVKPAVETFLKERNLQLSQEKTKITHIQQGFDFLGFNIRKYKDKLLIKPAKQNVLGFLKRIREIIKKNKATTSGKMINILNPKIRGWGYFYRHVVAKRTFSYVDHIILKSIYKWAKRRHPNKSTRWIVNKYFHNEGNLSWVFKGKEKLSDGFNKSLRLMTMATIPIQRHIKIRKEATPYNSAYENYFQNRREKKRRNTWKVLPQSAM